MNQVPCPLKSTSCKSHYTRPALYSHLLSSGHSADLKAKVLPRLKYFLKERGASVPYFEDANGKITSFCMGCCKAWSVIKSDHFDECQHRDEHFKKFKKLMGVEEQPVEEGESSAGDRQRIEELEKQLAAQKKEYEKKISNLERELAGLEEAGKEDEENATKFHKWLGIVIGCRADTNDYEDVVNEIKEGKRKSLMEMAKAPPSAPPPPPPPQPTAVAPRVALPAPSAPEPVQRILGTTRRMPKQIPASY